MSIKTGTMPPRYDEAFKSGAIITTSLLVVMIINYSISIIH